MLHQLQIDTSSSIPKYKQIVNSIISGIEHKLIGLNDKLPSINEVSIIHDVSRDTVEKAYRELKQKGLISSIPGKGYFTSTNHSASNRKVLLIFNNKSAAERQLANALSYNLREKACFESISYDGEITSFEAIIKRTKDEFTDFVIVPGFIGVDELRAKEAVNRFIAKEKLLLLNRKLDGLTGSFKMICQDLERTVFDCLFSIKKRLDRYEKLELFFPASSTISRGLIRGFQKYSIQYGINSKISFKDFDTVEPSHGTLYFVLRDEDGLALANKIQKSGLKLGTEVGILAYNDSPIKEKLLGGLTVMTFDYQQMGQKGAKMIISGEVNQIDQNYTLIERGSF